MSRRLIDFSRSFHAHTAKGEHTEYTVDALFSEMVWGHSAWSADEATSAAFRRIVKEYKAMKSDDRSVMAIEGSDFAHLMTIVRSINFQGPNAIGLSELRIGIALSEIEEAPKPKAKANDVATAAPPPIDGIGDTKTP